MRAGSAPSVGGPQLRDERSPIIRLLLSRVISNIFRHLITRAALTALIRREKTRLNGGDHVS